VIRGWQALSGIIGRKEMRRCLIKSYLKDRSLTSGLGRILVGLRKSEEDRILRGAVKCVDTERNTNGEGNLLGFS
jgi:hypothetical protein